MRTFLGVSVSAPCAGMKAEMGMMDPQYYAWCNMVGYWLRVRNMPGSGITKRVSDWDLYVFNSNPQFSTYSGEIYSILSQNGLVHYFTTYIKPNHLVKCSVKLYIIIICIMYS